MAQTIEILDRDDIADAVQNVLSNSELVSDAVDTYVRDQELLSKDEVDTQIDEALDNRNLLDDDDVQRIAREVFDNQEALSEDDVDRQIEDWAAANLDEKIDERIADLSNDDNEVLTRRIAELEQRLDRLYQRVDGQQNRFVLVLQGLRDLLSALAG